EETAATLGKNTAEEDEEIEEDPDIYAKPPTVEDIIEEARTDYDPFSEGDPGDIFGDAPARKRRPPIALIIAAILSFGLLFYVVIAYILPNQGFTVAENIKLPEFFNSAPEIVTEEDGQREVTADYSEEEYTTEYNETIKVPIGMYDVEVGEYCGDSWNTELIDVMVYHVQSIEDPSLYARLMVAPDGRIIGTGTLVNPDEPLKAYRVK
ncbi:MAG: hypothetical protein J6N76_09845, partial [Lachnospiraceae bacterium]|nr:hypothetical protein [Lachnospiraceae bacterium]